MSDLEHALAWRAPTVLQDWVGSGSHWLHKAQQLLGRKAGARFAPRGLACEVRSLRAGSKQRGLAILQGHFEFAGHRVTDAPGRIFAHLPPSPSWWDQLVRLDWLNDLVATDQELARLAARRLVLAWAAEALPRLSTAQAARALINLSCTATFVIETAPAEICSEFALVIDGLCRRMARRWPTPPALALDKAIALTTATTAFKVSATARSQAHAQLAKSLEQVIQPDGGHVSRNVSKLVDIALDLVPLRISLQSSRSAVPPALNAAIERILPMLRLMCMGDGGLACLQGAAPRTDDLNTLFSADLSQGRPLALAPHAGFSRLAFGDAVTVVDTGAPQNCKGTLGFEFSHGSQRIITSCGASEEGRKDWCDAMRRSAAHSTWDMGEASQGPEPRVTAEMIASPQGALLKTIHETARRHHRATHQRNLFLAASGLDLRGEEQVTAPHGNGELLRFHLHPEVQVEALPHPNCVALNLPNGETWSFSQAGGSMTIEDSIHLAADGTPRPCRQLTLRGVQAHGLHIQWALRKATATRTLDKSAKL